MEPLPQWPIVHGTPNLGVGPEQIDGSGRAATGHCSPDRPAAHTADYSVGAPAIVACRAVSLCAICNYAACPPAAGQVEVLGDERTRILTVQLSLMSELGDRRELRSTQCAKRGAQLFGEQLWLFPSGEVAALVDFVEIGEGWVGLLYPTARGCDDLAGERRESDRD
jgi:hypothetical protein